jgi:hypothetical protein
MKRVVYLEKYGLVRVGPDSPEVIKAAVAESEQLKMNSEQSSADVVNSIKTDINNEQSTRRGKELPGEGDESKSRTRTGAAAGASTGSATGSESNSGSTATGGESSSGATATGSKPSSGATAVAGTSK